MTAFDWENSFLWTPAMELRLREVMFTVSR